MATGKKKSTVPEKETRPHTIPEEDREYIKKIAALAKELREAKGFSYESYATYAKLNRNTYFRFERAASSGDNFTVGLLLQVIRGMNMTPTEFFQQIT